MLFKIVDHQTYDCLLAPTIYWVGLTRPYSLVKYFFAFNALYHKVLAYSIFHSFLRTVC